VTRASEVAVRTSIGSTLRSTAVTSSRTLKWDHNAGPRGPTS
jgi:hypothetical protein